MPGYDRSFPNGISNSGQVVGESLNADFTDHRATLWTKGRTIDLGTLGGLRSSALWISDKGQITGEAETSEGILNAVLWDKGQILDLHDHIPAENGWRLQMGLGVNSREQICGNGINPEGFPRAWVLTPRK